VARRSHLEPFCRVVPPPPPLPPLPCFARLRYQQHAIAALRWSPPEPPSADDVSDPPGVPGFMTCLTPAQVARRRRAHDKQHANRKLKKKGNGKGKGDNIEPDAAKGKGKGGHSDVEPDAAKGQGKGSKGVGKHKGNVEAERKGVPRDPDEWPIPGAGAKSFATGAALVFFERSISAPDPVPGGVQLFIPHQASERSRGRSQSRTRVCVPSFRVVCGCASDVACSTCVRSNEPVSLCHVRLVMCFPMFSAVLLE